MPFRLRVLTVDHYLAHPAPDLGDPAVSDFWPGGRRIHRVPVLRVVGNTPAGQSVCLHLHGVLPYFFIPYHHDLSVDPAFVAQYLRQLADDIEHALASPADSGRGPEVAPGALNPQQHVVHSALLIKAVPFYGYASHYKLFVKIFLYDPLKVRRVCNLLGSGAIHHRRYQPYEGHIPYELQFMTDHNVSGMSWLDVTHHSFRLPLPIAWSAERCGRRHVTVGAAEDGGSSGDPIYTAAGDAATNGAARTACTVLEADATGRDVVVEPAPAHPPPDCFTLGTLPAAAKVVTSLQAVWADVERYKASVGDASSPPSSPRRKAAYEPGTMDVLLRQRLLEVAAEEEADSTQAWGQDLLIPLTPSKMPGDVPPAGTALHVAPTPPPPTAGEHPLVIAASPDTPDGPTQASLSHSFMLEDEEGPAAGEGAFELLNWMREAAFEEAPPPLEGDEDEEDDAEGGAEGGPAPLAAEDWAALEGAPQPLEADLEGFGGRGAESTSLTAGGGGRPAPAGAGLPPTPRVSGQLDGADGDDTADEEDEGTGAGAGAEEPALAVGDCVYLQPGAVGGPLWVARIVELHGRRFLARWYYRWEDTPLRRDREPPDPRQLFYSEHCDRNSVASVVRRCVVLDREPYAVWAAAGAGGDVARQHGVVPPAVAPADVFWCSHLYCADRGHGFAPLHGPHVDLRYHSATVAPHPQPLIPLAPPAALTGPPRRTPSSSVGPQPTPRTFPLVLGPIAPTAAEAQPSGFKLRCTSSSDEPPAATSFVSRSWTSPSSSLIIVNPEIEPPFPGERRPAADPSHPPPPSEPASKRPRLLPTLAFGPLPTAPGWQSEAQPPAWRVPQLPAPRPPGPRGDPTGGAADPRTAAARRAAAGVGERGERRLTLAFRPAGPPPPPAGPPALDRPPAPATIHHSHTDAPPPPAPPPGSPPGPPRPLNEAAHSPGRRLPRSPPPPAAPSASAPASPSSPGSDVGSVALLEVSPPPDARRTPPRPPLPLLLSPSWAGQSPTPALYSASAADTPLDPLQSSTAKPNPAEAEGSPPVPVPQALEPPQPFISLPAAVGIDTDPDPPHTAMGADTVAIAVAASLLCSLPLPAGTTARETKPPEPQGVARRLQFGEAGDAAAEFHPAAVHDSLAHAQADPNPSSCAPEGTPPCEPRGTASPSPPATLLLSPPATPAPLPAPPPGPPPSALKRPASAATPGKRRRVDFVDLVASSPAPGSATPAAAEAPPPSPAPPSPYPLASTASSSTADPVAGFGSLGIPGCLGPLSYAGPHTLIAARGPPAVRASDALRPAALALPDPLTDIGLLTRSVPPEYRNEAFHPAPPLAADQAGAPPQPPSPSPAPARSRGPVRLMPVLDPPSRAEVLAGLAADGSATQLPPRAPRLAAPLARPETPLRPQLTPLVHRRSFGAVPTQITAATAQPPDRERDFVDAEQRRRVSTQAARDLRRMRLKILFFEIHVHTREHLNPDPHFDAIAAMFFALHCSDHHAEEAEDAYFFLHCTDAQGQARRDVLPPGTEVRVFGTERELAAGCVDLIRALDPDVIGAWDLQKASLGYFIQRATGILNTNLNVALSRVPFLEAAQPEGGEPDMKKDSWGYNTQSGIHLVGRVVLNVWRLMRSEVKAKSYSLCSIAHRVLGHWVPEFPTSVLTRWFVAEAPKLRAQAVDHLVRRTVLPLRIVNRLDIVNRTAEMAAIYGILFFDVLSRGSQFRVESMMLRVAKPLQYLVISPSKEQVRTQNPQEAIPLIMEPYSGYYRGPVIVLDFRSLYPSCIIAHNLCFCTCLGRVSPHRIKKLGAIDGFRLPQGFLQQHLEDITIAPNGVMFLKERVRKGVLPQLLTEILDTRFFVQTAMKLADRLDDKVTHRVNNARQLALKLIANVTFGYTAASATGRMPCSDVADAIVLFGRDTLERSIRLVNGHKEWGARVVYGDTDSLFIHVEGATKARAFLVGQQIAKHITALHASPIKLKMEKVFFPCFLVTKKRYVGYAYESPDQKEPIFDAKGVECVRRDQCNATMMVMEKCLRLLFDTEDVAAVRQYFQRQCSKIQRGAVHVQDLIFQKEVRLGSYAPGRLPPPAAIVGLQEMQRDPRSEPLYGERIPYVVCNTFSSRLVHMLQHPKVLLSYRGPSPPSLNATYYITRQIIPALGRLFSLIGIDLLAWYNAVPRLRRPRLLPAPLAAAAAAAAAAAPGRRRTIDAYYHAWDCCACGGPAMAGPATGPPLCEACHTDTRRTALTLLNRMRALEREQRRLWGLCGDCCGGRSSALLADACVALDCYLPFQKKGVAETLAQARWLHDTMASAR